MILQGLMEEKQLDFNQPFLSVRRNSSTAASENENKRKIDKSSAKRPPLPAYKSDLKSGPLSNPGTVPFVWERTPGRPRNENKSQTQAVEEPLIAPKLPPGRVLKVEQQNFDKVPKVTSVTQSRTESTVSSSQSVASLDDKATKHEDRNEVVREKESLGSEDGDEAYLDALDTLSRTESFVMNCSVSGLSGWDDQEVQSLPADQQARDFMMGRFLPAAKAMASETPHIQYTSRKPLVMQEQHPRQVRKIASGAKTRPIDPKWEKVLPHYAQDMSQEESEDESDDNDRYENYAPKVCGLFSRFCLLNPIPALRVEDRILSSANYVVKGKSFASHRTVTAHSRTAHHGKKSVDSDIQSGFAKEKDLLGNPEISKHVIDPHRRGVSRLSAHERTQFESTCESPVAEKTLYIDSVHKVKSSSSSSSELKCPTDHGQDDDFESLRKDSSIDTIDSSIDSGKHVEVEDEKATLQPEISVSLDSSLLACSDNSSDGMQMKNMTNHSNKTYSEKLELTKPGYQGSNLDNDFIAISKPEMVEHKKIESENEVYSSKKSSDGPIQNPVPLRNLKLASDLQFDSKSQCAAKLVEQKCPHIDDSKDNPSSLGSSKVEGYRKKGSENQLTMKLGHRVTSNASSLKHSLALPSPKAPSESWLKRTLPTVSSRNISSQSNLAARINAPTQAPKPAAASLDPKWEIIVKSSNVHHGHLRFSKELTPIPEA